MSSTSLKNTYDVKDLKIINVRPKFLRYRLTNGTFNSPILPLTAQRILFYAIFKIQRQNKVVEFTKAELESLIKADLGSFKDIYKHIERLKNYGMEIYDEKSERYIYINAFESLEYREGIFVFKFTESFLPMVNVNKDRFLQFGLMCIVKFKCQYSVYLYEYLKDNMWGDINKKENIDLQSFRDIFMLDDDEYSKNNSNFRNRCWGIAMNEINENTNYLIDITSTGRGHRTTYTITMLQDENFKQMNEASRFECPLGKDIINSSCHDCMQVNKCSASFDYYNCTTTGDVFDVIRDFMVYNRDYSLKMRIKNNVADEGEQKYWVYINTTDSHSEINRENINADNLNARKSQ